jgi:membrane-associated PAP2 superfamily phosphatase
MRAFIEMIAYIYISICVCTVLLKKVRKRGGKCLCQIEIAWVFTQELMFDAIKNRKKNL